LRLKGYIHLFDVSAPAPEAVINLVKRGCKKAVQNDVIVVRTMNHIKRYVVASCNKRHNTVEHAPCGGARRG